MQEVLSKLTRNGMKRQIIRSIRLKKSYVESWPFAQRTQNPPDPKHRLEGFLVIVAVFLPIQIVFGLILLLLKSLF